VTQIMDGYGYNYIEVLKDMSGVARFPFGYH
jgi:release factor glutamine methyltransferase